MLRWRVWGGVIAALLAVIFPALAVGAGGREATGRVVSQSPGSLAIFYASPVLARAGERVLMPVQVVCGRGGRACEARVTLSTRVGEEAWRSVTARAASDLTFDVSAPAARAVAAGAGSVQFVIRARDESGRQATLPPSGEAAPLAFFVTTRMPVRHIAGISFGRTRRGTTVLSLPWGSGPMRAGLSPARESAPFGPDSFDVDRRGRIYLLDPAQGRIALFASGRLIRQTPLPLTANAQLAADPQGVVSVVDRSSGALAARTVDDRGMSEARGALAGSMVEAVRMVDGLAYGLVLPLDAWVAVGAASRTFVGMPLSNGGQLLRIARRAAFRVARWTSTGKVIDAVEVHAPARIGEIPLAEPDRRDGCWVVVHLWREAPAAVDEYEVLHIVGTRVRASFAVSDRAFTDTPPLSRFRIGGDGALYQLVSTDAGIRIVRFDLKEER